MKPIGFRRVGPDAQEALRTRAIDLVRVLGKSQGDAAAAVGASRRTVNQWMKRHAAAGGAALPDGRRVSPRGGQGLLTQAEAGRVRGWITGTGPEHLGLPHALWTSGVVRELIRRRLGKALGRSTAQRYLARRGFTPQKPLSRATRRPDAAVGGWLERQCRKMARRAKREKALIHRGGETGIGNQGQGGRGHAPAGQSPVIRKAARKLGTSMIPAANNRGLMRLMCFKRALDTRLLIAFLRRLVDGAASKLFLATATAINVISSLCDPIVDHLRVRHAVKVRQWVAAHRDAIELFLLPAYAPEHNPDEPLNNDLKQLKNLPAPDAQEGLMQATTPGLRSPRRRPARIRAHFHPPDVRYAA